MAEPTAGAGLCHRLFDCPPVKILDEGTVHNSANYTALGIRSDGTSQGGR